MPFSTDANWPQGLLNIFDVSRNQNAVLEFRYYGPYDRLFNYAVVEGSFTFFLAPQTAPDDTFSQDVIRLCCLYGGFESGTTTSSHCGDQ